MFERAVSSKFRSSGSRLLCYGMVFAGLASCAGAFAGERHAYRYLDENGRVAYSEFQPATGIDWKPVDTTTAVTGRSVEAPRTKYGAESRYSSARRDASPELERKQAKIAAEAKEKKLVASAAAECRRNHGIGCKNSAE